MCDYENILCVHVHTYIHNNIVHVNILCICDYPQENNA